jgi:hypothetical protein
MQHVHRAAATSDGESNARRRLISARSALATADAPSAPTVSTGRSSICVSVTATSVESFISEISEVERAGADIVELRLDFIKVMLASDWVWRSAKARLLHAITWLCLCLQDFDTERDLDRILRACTKPYIVTYRPKWEG